MFHFTTIKAQVYFSSMYNQLNNITTWHKKSWMPSFTLPFKLKNYQYVIYYLCLTDSEFPEMDGICITSFPGKEPGLKTTALLHFMNFRKVEKLSCTSELQSRKNPTGEEPDAFHSHSCPCPCPEAQLKFSRAWVVLLCLLQILLSTNFKVQ